MRPSSCAVATANTGPVWPVKGAPTGFPVARSHTRTVLSQLPEIDHGAPVQLRGRHRGHGAGVAGEGGPDRCPGGQVPHPHRVVGAAGDHHGAPVQLRGRHPEHPVGVAGEGVFDGRTAAGSVPVLGRFAQTSAAPIRASVKISAPMPMRMRRRRAGLDPGGSVVGAGGGAGGRAGRDSTTCRYRCSEGKGIGGAGGRAPCAAGDGCARPAADPVRPDRRPSTRPAGRATEYVRAGRSVLRIRAACGPSGSCPSPLPARSCPVRCARPWPAHPRSGSARSAAWPCPGRSPGPSGPDPPGQPQGRGRRLGEVAG